MFPRETQFQKGVDIEASIYREFTGVGKVSLPVLIEYVNDISISSFPFIVTTRLEGIPFSEIIETINIDTLESILLQLVGLIADWHNIPENKISTLIKERSVTQDESFELSNIVNLLSNPSKFREAIYAVLAAGIDYFTFNKTEIDFLIKAIERINSLNSTLVHSDINEDQILIRKNNDKWEISGILDWESAVFTNPVKDFNFLEWGLQIWEYREHFASLRYKIWSKYCELRNIKVFGEYDLHIFYLFLELACVLDQKDKDLIVITNKPFLESVEIYSQNLKSLLV